MARPPPANKPKAFFGLRPAAGEPTLSGMKVGLISDTHNHLRESRRALDLLVARGARHLVHCGDVGEDVVALLSAVCREHGIRAHVAVGNCDRAHLEDAPFLASPAGIERAEAPEFVLAGKRCLALHGDNETRLEAALAAETFDYVFTGHSHASADQRSGKTRRLNPGSPVRPRRGPPTVALLDLETDLVEWLPV